MKAVDKNYVNNVENILVSNKYRLEEKCFKCANVYMSM